jgi:hypothetical protein
MVEILKRVKMLMPTVEKCAGSLRRKKEVVNTP